MYRIGQLIKVETSVRETLEDLNLMGYHAVRADYNGEYVRITGICNWKLRASGNAGSDE